jgi:hypothetical protein
MSSGEINFMVSCETCGGGPAQSYTRQELQEAINAGMLQHFCGYCSRSWPASPDTISNLKRKYLES